MENPAKFCVKCGAPLKEGKAFCVKCGAPVQVSPAGKDQPHAAQEQAPSEPAYAAPEPNASGPTHTVPQPGSARPGASVFKKAGAIIKAPPSQLTKVPKADAVITLVPARGKKSLLLVGLAALAIVVLQFFFHKTKVGKAIRATAQNRNAAAMMGIPVGKMDSLAAAISAALGGIGGVLIGPIFYVETEMGALAGLKGFAAAVLGGFGSIPGAITGGVVLGLAENLSARYISSVRRRVGKKYEKDA